MPLGSEAKFCLGFGVGAKFGVGVCAKLEAGFGVGAKTGSGVGRGGGGEGGWRKSLGSKSFDILVLFCDDFRLFKALIVGCYNRHSARIENLVW